jgi:hypothetical protein
MIPHIFLKKERRKFRKSMRKNLKKKKLRRKMKMSLTPVMESQKNTLFMSMMQKPTYVSANLDSSHS